MADATKTPLVIAGRVLLSVAGGLFIVAALGAGPASIDQARKPLELRAA